MLRFGCFLFVAAFLILLTINLPFCGIPLILALIIYAALKTIS